MPQKEYKLRVGSRAQVMHGTAKMTGGGLKKKQLKYNKHGKIVSRKASKAAKKTKNLQKAGYFTKKGQFGAYRKMIKYGGTANNIKEYDNGNGNGNDNGIVYGNDNGNMSVKTQVKNLFDDYHGHHDINVENGIFAEIDTYDEEIKFQIYNMLKELDDDKIKDCLGSVSNDVVPDDKIFLKFSKLYLYLLINHPPITSIDALCNAFSEYRYKLNEIDWELQGITGFPQNMAGGSKRKKTRQRKKYKKI